MNSLTLDRLKEIVSGNAAALRRVVELQPAGGPGAKVFPPTYEGGKYATEKRRINGELVDCVLLDSVQSQANRMELALQEAVDERRISLPVITVDFSDTGAWFIGRVTSLEAPHRIADAILRDSNWDDGKGKKVPFRKTPAGAALDAASLQNATALFGYCPTALVFGMWDSTGARGGLGVKFPRAIVSEIIGIGAVPGQRTGGRLDPLQISSKAGPVYETEDGDWTLDPTKAKRKKDKHGNEVPALYGEKGKPSEINHGNVTPSLVVQKDNRDQPILDEFDKPIPIGGFTIDRAQQITVISLPALRRLRFPVNGNNNADLPGRVALTALALCAATLSSEKGYNLRSQCDLVASGVPQWEIPGQNEAFSLNAEDAVKLFNQAVKEAQNAGLPWNAAGMKLTPRDDLVEMVLRSRERGGEEQGEEEA
ncbi:MAG: type I-U CRISPR-associated protein Cas7 [Candidatus Thermofonsia Clade 3 bacterium]|jgi:CRISPR-associated protein Csb1|uniref:Type I-U CRISPR-associated protein Cas7 n=1 Tax=Candidatus Thermofonsia Clade 3 bacterium TaxID=2364212 RepID=A0A2M8QA77_9CHLR|nr:type I-U CRISPR-associated RAMP protein Csb1/Cas7u [Candidatus Roseilinea sp. NK_OTU-006]PJF46706.1 MAG: type I-U CRISPR-associated protein Cas7 [Candidatus Thermofonsia Clade 3 bacterium]